MYRLSLFEARAAAKEFLRRVEALESTFRVDSNLKSPRIPRSKASGAMVRASMELSRKLSDLRCNR